MMASAKGDVAYSVSRSVERERRPSDEKREGQEGQEGLIAAAQLPTGVFESAASRPHRVPLLLRVSGGARGTQRYRMDTAPSQASPAPFSHGSTGRR